MSQPRTPRLKVGDVLRLDDRDYKYGTGPLVLRVTAIGDVAQERDGAWLNLRGHRLRPDGAETGMPEQYALVRISALRRNSPPPEPSR